VFLSTALLHLIFLFRGSYLNRYADCYPPAGREFSLFRHHLTCSGDPAAHSLVRERLMVTVNEISWITRMKRVMTVVGVVGNDKEGSVGSDGEGKFIHLRHSGEGRNPMAQVFVPVSCLGVPVV